MSAARTAYDAIDALAMPEDFSAALGAKPAAVELAAQNTRFMFDGP